MKQAQLKPCNNCGKGIMHSGSPIFYRVLVEPHVVNLRAVQRQHGLETMLGAAAPLAQVLGPNEDIAEAVEGAEVDVFLCLSCFLSGLPIAALVETSG